MMIDDKPTYILYYIKSSFHVFDWEWLQMDEWISIDQLKREYHENKETEAENRSSDPYSLKLRCLKFRLH